MVTLRQHINNLTTDTNRKINKDVYIEKGIVYIDNGACKYKYRNDCYFILAGNNWINMQGGIPAYYLEENPDEDVFVSVEREVEDVV